MKTLWNKTTSHGYLNNNTQRVFPTSESEAVTSKNKIKFRKHFISLSKDQLIEEGITGFRNNFAGCIQSLTVGIIALIVTIIYSLYVFSILAAEESIYSSKAGAIAVESVELLFMGLFIIEIFMYIVAFGIRLYFRDMLNMFDIILILLTIIWYIMDIWDSDKYREKAAFRVIRVALMFWRLRFGYFTFVSRIKYNRSFYNVEFPINQVCQILGSIRDHITDSKIASDINYWLDVITSGKIYQFKRKAKIQENNDENLLISKRNQINKPSIEEIKKKIQKVVSKIDIKKELNISSETLSLLDEVDKFEFNIFELNKQTNGNEMITLATYLIHKHNLFVDLTVEFNTFGIFIIKLIYWK